MKETTKIFFLRLLNARSLIVGAAIYNFSVVWVVSNNWSLLSFIDPWFIPWSFTNEPTRLLVAAFSLRLGRAWSYLLAVVLSGYIVIAGLIFNVSLAAHWELLESWAVIIRFGRDPLALLGAQHMLAMTIFIATISYFRKNI